MWQKESSEENAMHVDLFASEDKQLLWHVLRTKKRLNKKPKTKKNARLAMERREEADKLCADGEYLRAIEVYNASLCAAPPNSEALGLAYADRSLCFLNLKMYNECLVDIKLARQNNYPENLSQKLDERVAECLTAIQNGEQKTNDIGSTLSYDEHERFPGLANVLNVVEHGRDNFTVFATEDIGVGKTVSLEKAYTAYMVMGNNLKCSICLKRNTNLVPCSRCTSALFCHDECKNNTVHEGECGLLFSGLGDLDAAVLTQVRLVLMAVDMFTDIDELMDFVQKTIKHVPMDEHTLSEAKSRYRNFLKLPFSPIGANLPQLLPTLWCMYQLSLEIEKVNQFFNTEKHRRYLMHLLAHHYQITDDNSSWSKRSFLIDGQVKNICTHGIIGLRNRFFGLSCAPNVMHYDHNNLSVFITIRPVRQGEPLLTCIAGYLLLQARPSRQQAHWTRRNVACQCSRCQGLTATAAQQQEIKNDPDYHDVSSRKDDADEQVDGEKYVNFLNKYGHMPWCDAIGNVVDAYLHFLRNKMSGETFTSDMIDAFAKHNMQ